MQKLGRHLIVEYYGCDQEILNNINTIKEHMMIAAKKTGATIVGEMFHKFNPIGTSGVVVLAESHISIHTWPEYGYAAMDFFTCGNYCNPYNAFDYLKQILKATRESVKEVTRGLPDDIKFDIPVTFKPSVEKNNKDIINKVITTESDWR